MDPTQICLRLALTPGIGPAAAQLLLGTFSDPADILSAGTAALRDAGLNEAQAEAVRRGPDPARLEAALKWAADPDNHLLALTAAHYPVALRDLSDPPVMLFVTGDCDVLHTPQLAMVGSRTPTPAAARTAREFAAALGGAGLTITSGLALGIDGESHRGALDAGALTVAVTATGPDRVYPAAHRDLVHQIVAAGGAMVTEFPPGVGVHQSRFPRRNRLISALSLGTLVVEAATRSGSLITARLAGELGREVLAIPGSIHNPLSRGCHRLIREGAKLVETAADVLEELASRLGELSIPEPGPDAETAPAPAGELDAEYRHLLACLDYSPTPIDQLVERSGLPAGAVASMLLSLELQGYAESAGANRYMRTGSG
ncbi:DNA-processing protein DprA [Granulosicoccaceae sp. 1_MG-2023]|nr:DNA-processing protein DprA [Granulosicoccaceae sp. 1_MG-2023]